MTSEEAIQKIRAAESNKEAEDLLEEYAIAKSETLVEIMDEYEERIERLEGQVASLEQWKLQEVRSMCDYRAIRYHICRRAGLAGGTTQGKR